MRQPFMYILDGQLMDGYPDRRSDFDTSKTWAKILLGSLGQSVDLDYQALTELML